MIRFAMTAAMAVVAFSPYPQVSAFSETQALSRADPISPTDGINIPAATGIRVTACASGGATLTGGMLWAWSYIPSIGMWSRNVDNDMTISTTLARQCQTWQDSPVYVQSGQFLAAAHNVTTSNGGGVTVAIEWVAK